VRFAGEEKRRNVLVADSLLSRQVPIFGVVMNLTDDDRADLARFLADRCPLSPRVRRLKALLAKIDPVPAPTGGAAATTESRRGSRVWFWRSGGGG
jgi:hypothetical protein